MKIGLSVGKLEGVEYSRIAKVLSALRVDHVELHPHALEALDCFPPSISMGYHLPYVSLGWDLAMRPAQKKIDDLIKVLNKEASRIKWLVTHLPEYETADLGFLIENIKKCDARVLLENPHGYDFKKTEDCFREARKHVDVGFLIDFPHIAMSEKDILAVPQYLLDNLEYVHLSDCTIGNDEHFAFGLGNLPVEEVLEFLKEIGFDGIVNLEVEPKELRGVLDVLNSYMMVLKKFKPLKYCATLPVKKLVDIYVGRELKKMHL